MSEKRILLVAGEKASLTRAISSGLSALGYAVSAVEDANEAWRLLGREAHHAIIIEVVDTAEGCLVARMLHERWPIPIMIVSHNCNLEAEVHSYRAGADAFLRVPCDMQELVARLESLLRRAELSARQRLDRGVLRPDYSRA